MSKVTSEVIYDHHIRQMFKIAEEVISRSPVLNQFTGSINGNGDKSLQMDVELETALIEYLKQQNLPVSIFSEEIGIVNIHESPEFLVTIDPLDGSTNYRFGKGLMPFGVLISFYKNLSPNIGDVFAAGLYECTSGLSWVFDGGKTYDKTGQAVAIHDNWEIDPATPVYLDLYWKESFERYQNLPHKIFVRNTGSTAGNLALVLANTAAAIGCPSMKPEEIGAVYGLLKGAGALVTTEKGDDLGELALDTQKKYSILGGASIVVDFVLQTIAD